MQYLGRVKVTVNGEVLDTRPGATLDLGGIQRTDVVNDQAMGYSEALKPSRIEVEVSLRKGQSIEALRNLRDTTCVFECDTQQRFVIKDAYTVDTITVTGGEGGRVKLVLAGQPAQEVVS